MTTKEQTRFISRQPFSLDTLIGFCGTKKLATRLAIDLGDALRRADAARNWGYSDDTVFELSFWDGTLFIDSDEQYDLGINPESLVDFCFDRQGMQQDAYDEKLDATFYLCSHGQKTMDDVGRRFIAVRYEYKEDSYAVSAWWLTKE